MSIKFTEIPDKLKYPPKFKAELSTLHSAVVEYVSSNYSGTFKNKNEIINCMNVLMYWIIDGNSMPTTWSQYAPLANLPEVDDDDCRKLLGSLYLMVKDVAWDVTINSQVTKPISSSTSDTYKQPTKVEIVDTPISVDVPTPKSDLYIKPPVVPRFDTKSVWMQGVTPEGLELRIYPTLPRVPTKQNEISITTDVNKMTSRDLLKLYPNTFIQTRAAAMYNPVDTLKFHDKLGVILHISGFTEDEVVDNMIKYPHLFKLVKIADDTPVSFYTTIEIDGCLHKVGDIWSKLEDSKYVPYSAEFIKEYVVRRYLLERDIKGVQHKYPMQGTLLPFLTLFMSPDDYIDLGYKDIENMARQCVDARVSYKQSRSPIIRRLQNV